MVDGLRVTISGDELHRLLGTRADQHRATASRVRTEQEGEAPDSDEIVQLPEHIYEAMIDEHEWRASVLDFLRDHLDTSEVYRLSEADLTFGELLPAKPPAMAQEEYEERTGIAFNLGRLTKAITSSCPDGMVLRMAEPSSAERRQPTE